MTASGRRLTTVLRVAALQETVARAQAGRAGAAVERAVEDRDARRAAVSAGALPVGTRAADVQQAATMQGLRAQAVAVAEADLAAAEDARADAVAAWSRSRSRSRLLEQLDVRQRAERVAARIGQAQRLADDLVSARRAAARPRPSGRRGTPDEGERT